MKFVEEEDKAPEGVPLNNIPAGEMFQWDGCYWMQCQDTKEATKRVTRLDLEDEYCVAVCLENGRLQSIPYNTVVLPIDARIRIIGVSEM